MKYSHFKLAISVLFAVCTAFIVQTSAYAIDANIYINNSSEPVPDATDELYAIGGEGLPAVLEDKSYALSENGLEEVSLYAEKPSPTPEVTPEPNYTDVQPAYNVMKIGLNYGKTALTEVCLENDIGNGFLFGYFDRNRDFHQVAFTNNKAITMTADLNITIKDDLTIGCWHILLPSSYSSFETAKAKADELGGFAAYYSGSYFVLYGQYTSRAEAQEAINANAIDGKAFSASQRCVVVSETGTGKILFEFDCGTDYDLAIRPVSEQEKAITWFDQNRYYGDFQCARLSNNEYLTVVNYVDIEDYTKGVVPYEMYASWPLEALKAQALCARNYAVTNFNRYRSHGFDLTADIYSQVYKGIGTSTAETNQAVEETAGKYIRYKGEICRTFFFSSDGGATESSENVWGTPVAYLQGVVDPYEADVKTYYDSWSYELTPEKAQALLNERFGCNLNKIASIECIYTEMDNVKALVYTDVDGKSYTVRGSRCSYAIDGNSLRFKIELNDDKFIVTGSGWGHNCGMSQYGALSMAKVHGKTAEDIIKFYYTGVYIR